jgi:hypothetical protein
MRKNLKIGFQKRSTFLIATFINSDLTDYVPELELAWNFIIQINHRALC